MGACSSTAVAPASPHAGSSGRFGRTTTPSAPALFNRTKDSRSDSIAKEKETNGSVLPSRPSNSHRSLRSPVPASRDSNSPKLAIEEVQSIPVISVHPEKADHNVASSLCPSDASRDVEASQAGDTDCDHSSIQTTQAAQDSRDPSRAVSPHHFNYASSHPYTQLTTSQRYPFLDVHRPVERSTTTLSNLSSSHNERDTERGRPGRYAYPSGRRPSQPLIQASHIAGSEDVEHTQFNSFNNSALSTPRKFIVANPSQNPSAAATCTSSPVQAHIPSRTGMGSGIEGEAERVTLKIFNESTPNKDESARAQSNEGQKKAFISIAQAVAEAETHPQTQQGSTGATESHEMQVQETASADVEMGTGHMEQDPIMQTSHLEGHHKSRSLLFAPHGSSSRQKLGSYASQAHTGELPPSPNTIFSFLQASNSRRSSLDLAIPSPLSPVSQHGVKSTHSSPSQPIASPEFDPAMKEEMEHEEDDERDPEPGMPHRNKYATM